MQLVRSLNFIVTAGDFRLKPGSINAAKTLADAVSQTEQPLAKAPGLSVAMT
jgi:hypothetical protein